MFSGLGRHVEADLVGHDRSATGDGDELHSMTRLATELTMAPTSFACRTPGKINLTLENCGPRPDGFHELRSLVVGVGLGDSLGGRATDGQAVEITCSDLRIRDNENLVVRAANLLAARLGRDPAVKIELEKHIPLGGGMGGGSSDAAATLRVCNALWNGGLNDEDLARLGAEIGSDVPLFFHLPAALIRGRGELVEPVALNWAGWVVLLMVNATVSTSAVYGSWSAEDGSSSGDDPHGKIPAASSADEIMSLCFNDLEPAVFRTCSLVERAFAVIQDEGLGPVRVSGAGSTIFRLFDHEDAATQFAGHIKRLGMEVATAVVRAPVGAYPLKS